MFRWIAAIALIGAISGKAEAPTRWQYAGENKGIRFYFRIANECREEGAKLELKLDNTLDQTVTVSFRLVDPDWKETFEREVGPRMEDTAIKFTPEEGTSCHPYVDEVYVQPRESQVSHAGETEGGEDGQPSEMINSQESE